MREENFPPNFRREVFFSHWSCSSSASSSRSVSRFSASSGLRESTCVRRMMSAVSLSAMADSDS